MYDFSKQKVMLDATLLLLEENNLSEIFIKFNPLFSI